MARILYFECLSCGEKVAPSFELPMACSKCRSPLLVRYNLDDLKKNFKLSTFDSRVSSMWRYREVLPEVEPVTLGEGFTPLMQSREFHNVFIKDEARNPAGSYEARGMSVAVSMARHHGLKKLAVASDGNAAAALAAYAAVAGIEAYVFMPQNSPKAIHVECQIHGAQLTLVDGSVSDCECLAAEGATAEGWIDLSEFREPFRLEGAKTIGYEVFEQLGGKLPDAIICPVEAALIGMWKSFDEMQQLGWLGTERPKMIAVQVGEAVRGNGDLLMQRVLKASSGTTITVTDEQMMSALRRWATVEGVFSSPQGATSLAGYMKLREAGALQESDKVILLNTASGLKYIDVIGKYFKWIRPELPKSRNIGGIIQPY